MTDSQLQKILDWIPEFLIALGLFLTTIAGIFIKLKNDLKALKDQGEVAEQQKVKLIEQGHRIETLANGTLTAVRSELSVAVERIAGLEKLLVAQVDATRAAVTATIPGPQGEKGEKGEPAGATAEPQPVVISDIDAAAARKLAELAKAGKPPKPDK